MDDDIPPLLPIHQVPPLRTQADLHRQWRAMMGPLGFAGRRLWLLFLEPDDRPTELLLQIDDIPEDPREGEPDSLLLLCREVRREHGLGRVAVLLSRPGEGTVRPSDRRGDARSSTPRVASTSRSHRCTSPTTTPSCRSPATTCWRRASRTPSGTRAAHGGSGARAV